MWYQPSSHDLIPILTSDGKFITIFFRMIEDEPTYTGVFAGHTNVGKTTLGQRLTGDIDMVSPQPTINNGNFTIFLSEDGNRFKLFIHDTAGQERYDSITKSYFRGVQFAIIVFSLDDEKSYELLDKYFDYLSEGSPDAKPFLVGNKLDLVDSISRVVSYEDAKNYAEQKGAQYFEVSAKTGDGIREFTSALGRANYLANEQVQPKIEKKGKESCCMWRFFFKI